MSGVLDASAVLAVYLDEPGADVAERVLAGSLLSSVNYTEVIGKALDRGRAFDHAVVALAQMAFVVVAHDLALARRAGGLRIATRALGLSVGDRACLALAEREGLPVYTADRNWARLDLGVDIRLIR